MSDSSGKSLLFMLTLVVLASAQLVQSQITNRYLEAVCVMDKGLSELSITSPRKLIEMIEMRKSSNETECLPKYDGAFDEIEKIVSEQMLKDICSSNMYELIRKFHTRFIHWFVPELNDDQLRINNQTPANLERSPRVIREFFILFATQVSSMCKQHLVSTLMDLFDNGPEGIKLNFDPEFQLLKVHETESYRLLTNSKTDKELRNKVLTPQANNFDNLKILDLEKFGEPEDEGSKLYLKVHFNDKLKQIKLACQKKFTPVYSELFSPVIKLQNLGYIDHKQTESEDKAMEQVFQFKRWLSIIQTCELIKDMVIVHDNTDTAAIADMIMYDSHLVTKKDQTKGNKFKIMTKSEYENMEKRIAKSAHGLVSAYMPKKAYIEHEPVDFSPRLWVTEPKAIKSRVELFDKNMKNLIHQQIGLIPTIKKSVTMLIRSHFITGRQHFIEQNSESQLGRLALFLNRHKAQIQVAFIILAIGVLTARVATG